MFLCSVCVCVCVHSVVARIACIAWRYTTYEYTFSILRLAAALLA